MSKITGSEAVIKCLLEEQVDIIYGYPGGAIMPVYDELYKYQDKIHHVLTRHEQGATHSAQGFARISGRVGVAIATSGPGATNLVTGLADAQIDSTPMVCITGQVSSHLLGSDAFQETDIIGISTPVTKWNYQITKASEIPCNSKKLDGILYTHEHADHTAGLDDIRPFYFKQGKIDLILTKRVFSFLSKRFDYIIDDNNKYPGAPSVNIKLISKNKKFTIGNKVIVPIEVFHGTLPIIGYRIDNFAYLTDVKSISDNIIKKLKKAKVKPIGIEGYSKSEWVLIDFGDVLVHVMHPDAREFYSLEKLWDESLSNEQMI